ncbi:MAG: c-type cytochrome biogenesis protein CcmI [Gemmatimonadota bacterium]
MTLLVLAIVLAVIAAGLVVYPLIFRQWGILGDVFAAEVEDSEARKRVALANLKDVEYDRAAGKLDDVDYQEIRSRLEQEALTALQAVERSSQSAASAGPRAHSCGFSNPHASRYCAGCGQRLA